MFFEYTHIVCKNYSAFERILVYGSIHKPHIVCKENSMKASIRTKMAMSISSSQADVFLRSHFDRFGSKSRVTRAIQDLIKDGKLVRLGYGVYAKARPSSITGSPIPRKVLESLVEEALNALSVKFELGSARADYAAGRTTQIPMAVTIKPINNRIQRKISLGGREVIYERHNSFSV